MAVRLYAWQKLCRHGANEHNVVMEVGLKLASLRVLRLHLTHSDFLVPRERVELVVTRCSTNAKT